MMHRRRTWQIATVSLDSLIEKLSNGMWTICTGFDITLPAESANAGERMLILNDATGEDGAQEYAFCHVLAQDGDTFTVRQYESVTISWCTPDHIASQMLAWLDERDLPSRELTITAEQSGSHRCRSCA